MQDEKAVLEEMKKTSKIITARRERLFTWAVRTGKQLQEADCPFSFSLYVVTGLLIEQAAILASAGGMSQKAFIEAARDFINRKYEETAKMDRKESPNGLYS